MNIEQTIFDFGWVISESVIVGSYVVLLFLLITQVFYFSDWNLLLFVLGFIKHFFGYLLGIQNLYCRYGYACRNITRKKQGNTTKTSNDILMEKIVESVLEGIAFVAVGLFINVFYKIDKIYVVFLTGVLLNLISELLGLHAYFCEYGCKQTFYTIEDLHP